MSWRSDAASFDFVIEERTEGQSNLQKGACSASLEAEQWLEGPGPNALRGNSYRFEGDSALLASGLDEITNTKRLEC
jgi:hypothetical protein